MYLSLRDVFRVNFKYDLRCAMLHNIPSIAIIVKYEELYSLHMSMYK